MAYFTLTGGAGYLARETNAQAANLTSAMNHADAIIDEEFRAWNRTLWTGSGIPSQIARAAELLGVGRYFAGAQARAKQDENDKPLGERLTDEGWALIARIKSQGGPIDANGNIESPDRSVPGLYGIEVHPT